MDALEDRPPPAMGGSKCGGDAAREVRAGAGGAASVRAEALSPPRIAPCVATSRSPAVVGRASGRRAGAGPFEGLGKGRDLGRPSSAASLSFGAHARRQRARAPTPPAGPPPPANSEEQTPPAASGGVAGFRARARR